MTQNTEQNVRTRDAQIRVLANLRDDVLPTRTGNAAREYAEAFILEAEARGAEEQRWKDGEARDTPSAYVRPDDFYNDEGDERCGPWSGDQVGKYTLPLYTRPANIAALEAEIASLKEAEQLARADAEASKARVEMLEGQITALNTPQYYAVEGDDFAQNSIADIFDDCDAERNTIIQVNGYRQVSSEWALFDGESLHTFPTEAEAEAAHPSLTREGGV